MTYRWLANPDITRQLGGLRQADREDFFRVREGLEEDPQSERFEARRDPQGEADEWIVPFGEGCVLFYRIVDDADAPTLDPRAIRYRPLPD